MADTAIRIVVAHDHTLFRESLCAALRAEEGFDVVGAAADGRDVIPLVSRVRPDIVLMDVEIPNLHPGMALARILEVSPRPRTVLLSSNTDLRLVEDMLQAGASGYLHKSVGWQDLATAIRRVHGSYQQVTVPAVPRTGHVGSVHPTRVLTERERQVLSLVAYALSNRQISVHLAITEGTVKRHLRNIFGKLGAVSRIDAVNKAIAGGQLRDSPRSGTVAAAGLVPGDGSSGPRPRDGRSRERVQGAAVFRRQSRGNVGVS